MIDQVINLKIDFCVPERLYDEIYSLVKDVLPEENTMTNNFYGHKETNSCPQFTYA